MRTQAVAFITILIGLTLSLRAQTAAPPLADRIPGDAMLYVGWAGTDALAGKYDKSHLKPVMDASAMPQFFADCVPKLIDRVAQENSEAADVLRELVAIGGPMWKHPTAVYFGGIDFNGPVPLPKLAVLCDAGRDAAAMADRIDKLLKEAEKEQSGPFPLVKVYGSMVVFAFGTPADIDAQFSAAPADPISKAPKFVRAFQQVQKDPAFIEYIDSPLAVKMVDDVIEKKADAVTSDGWKRARDSLGLTGLHQIIATMGFDGRDWASEGFVGSSDGDQGILSMVHGTPLEPQILKAVPLTADRMAAGKFDLDNFVGHLHDIVGQIQPSVGEQVDEVMSQINQAAGLDIRKDFLAVLGDEWCSYSDPSIAGSGMLGTVVVNRLRDAEAADKALTQISRRINSIVAEQLQQQKMTIEFQKEVINGLTVHYLAVPFVTPSWAISDGNLYFGLYPQVVVAAADQVKKHAPSILDKPEYKAVMKRLGDHPAGTVEFCNLPATAPDSYSNLLLLSRMYLGGVDMLGVHPPALTIPPLNKIVPELSPSGAVSWTDSAGLHMRSISPFPGCELIASFNKAAGILDAEQAPVFGILPIEAPRK
jgi:hypothetical protein